MITGITAGAATPSVFEADPLPIGSKYTDGTTFVWSADDPSVSLTQSSPNSEQVSVSTPASNTNTAFTLSVIVTMPNATGPAITLTSSAKIPIAPAASSIPTGVEINQIS